MRIEGAFLLSYVGSITRVITESNCSMIEKKTFQKCEFIRFNLYLCHVYDEFYPFGFAAPRIETYLTKQKNRVIKYCSQNYINL